MQVEVAPDGYAIGETEGAVAHDAHGFGTGDVVFDVGDKVVFGVVVVGFEVECSMLPFAGFDDFVGLLRSGRGDDGKQQGEQQYFLDV